MIAVVFFHGENAAVTDENGKINFRPTAPAGLRWSWCSFDHDSDGDKLVAFRTEDGSGFHLSYHLQCDDVVCIFHSKSLSGLINELPLGVSILAYNAVGTYLEEIGVPGLTVNDLDTLV